jgi:DNA-binding CsgD family transcriptional regulator
VARILASDYRKAFEVLSAAGEAEGGLAFPEPVLQALRELVPCDVVTFHERSASPERVLVYAGEPLGEVTAEIRTAHRRLKHEDPLRPAEGARKVTDFISLREFRRCEFYHRVHRPLGIEYMLQLYLDPRRTDARLEFDRVDSDFGERDRNVLDLLLPHLRQVLRSAEHRPPGPSGSAALTSRELECIAHVAQGRTNGEVGHALGISPGTVRKHLENAYEKLGVHTRTGAVAAVSGAHHAPREKPESSAGEDLGYRD